MKKKLLLLLALLMTAATGAWAQSALTGAFTINADGDQVQFSSGNLQATYNGTAWSWAFATNQWDIIGNEAANTSINGDGTISGTGTVDLFGWVGVNSAFTGTAIYGITNSTTANQYGNTKDEALKSDWGNTIGAGWYTLTIDEWTYVLNTRTTTSGVRYAKATVNGIEGLILLPDDWSTGYYSLASTNTTDAAFTSNEISSTDWTNSLEAHGAVFLPACGYRNGTTVTISSPNQGFYWSSTSSSSNALQARRLNFNNIGLNLNSGTVRTRGHSVRLVKAAEASPGGSGDETYSVKMKDGVKDADKWTITPNEGLKEGDAVTLTYSGRLKVKGVKATSDAAPAGAKAAKDATAEDLGKVIGADGNIYDNADAATAAGTTASAIIAYVGTAGSVDESSSTYKGLAIALTDANSGDACQWYTANSGTCVSQTNANATAITYMDGIASTNTLTSDGHTHAAADAARNYSTARPSDVSAWFLPSMGQWNLIVQGLATKQAGSTVSTNLTGSTNDTYKADNLNTVITAAGGTGFQSNRYQSSTEYGTNRVWNMAFNGGNAASGIKSNVYYVRAVFAF